MKDFQKLAKKKKFTIDKYPYANLGLKVYKIDALIIKLYLIFQVLKFIIFKFVTLDDELKQTISLISHYFTLTLVAMLALYIVLMFLRSRNHERQILANDFKAKRLRKKLLKQVAYKTLYKEEKSKLANQEKQNKQQSQQSKKQKSGGSRSRQIISKSDKMRPKAYKIASKFKVLRNTRTSFGDASKLETQTRIIVKRPFKNGELTSQVDSIVADLSEEATQATSGKTDFGKVFMSTNHRADISRGINSKIDKYYYEPSEEDNLPEISESTYSLSLFPDKSEDNAQKRDDAEYWASNTINRVKTILKNAKFHCTYYGYQINSSVARITFEIAEDNESVQFDRLPQLLNQSLGMKNCDVLQEENYIHIMIPLPDRFQSVMDMSTLMREVFNKEED